MLFNSFAFLCFFPLFTAAYWSTRGRPRLWICLAASYIFYAWWDWRFVPLLVVSTLLDFALGIGLQRQSDPVARKRLILVSVVANLGYLGFFKYAGFMVDSATSALNSVGAHVDPPLLRIVLPVGISFYVFKTMSYTIDVYRGTQEAERDLLTYATFVAFFPELVAGPIVRASRMLPQLKRDQKFNADRMISGVSLMLSGYVRKIVIADTLAPLVDARFSEPSAQTSLSLLIGAYLYAFQIYCDFSGYSDIAIGAARTLGFDFGINFNRPYFATSFSQFWTRWHISLSSWLRDYLYIPLGGNRGGTFSTYRSLMLTMLLGGLWHGASWTFVAWGALHGTYLVIQRMLSAPAKRIADLLRVPTVIRSIAAVLLVFHLTCLAWILFRAPSFDVAALIVRRIFTDHSWSPTAIEQKFFMAKALLLVFGLAVIEGVSLSARAGQRVSVPAYLKAAASLWLIALFGTFSGNSFIYFQF